VIEGAVEHYFSEHPARRLQGGDGFLEELALRVVRHGGTR
jgi:hypothetical protein